MSIYEKTINEYLEVASSRSPTPGGGSVSAVVATNAAAMVAMVANLTVGKNGYDDVQDATKRILSETNHIIERLKDLTARDIAAFETFMAAFRLPKATDVEKSYRTQAIEREAKNATEIPLAIASACLDILVQATAISSFGNKTAISDVGVAAHIAFGALRAALLSVDINLPSIEDQAFVTEALNERNRLLVNGGELEEKSLSIVRSRMK